MYKKVPNINLVVLTVFLDKDIINKKIKIINIYLPKYLAIVGVLEIWSLILSEKKKSKIIKIKKFYCIFK